MLFLGHILKDGKIYVDDPKLKSLDQWQSPFVSTKQVRQFVGFASYYRAFIPRFAQLSAPLTDLLRKQSDTNWTEEAMQSVEALKRALLDANALYAWDVAREDRVVTDASGVGVGAVFEQRVSGVG